MWKYVKKYLPFAILAGLFMVGEVMMDLVQPEIMSRIVDDGVLGIHTDGIGDMKIIWSLGLWMIGFVLFGGLCGSMNNVFSHISAQNIGNGVRKDAFRKIMTFSFHQIEQFGTGSLVTRVTNDITQVQNLTSAFVRGLIRTSMLTFGSIYFMFRLNQQFGFIVLCAVPFVVGCLAVCLHKANPLFGALQTQLDRINAIIQEDVSGIRIVKACVREIYEKTRFGKANDELIKTQLRVLIIFAFMNPVVNALMYLAVAAVLLAGSFKVSAGSATPGDIMAAITYTTQLLNGITGLVMMFQNISRGFASWKRLKEILCCSPELKDGGFDGDDSLSGQIEFRDVSFSYPDSAQMVLKHINLTIHSGETVAIMGTTGCGKSSMVNLIPRFYDTTEGTVLVDGIDVKAYNQKHLREKIAFALQKSELFCVSIRENIAWGASDADMEAIRVASQIAQSDSFICNTPDGYRTMVAERGMSLSGGQKQRISLARAVVKNAEILIFDDATSALDLKTEADFYAAIKAANSSSTKVIIAHRIATVRHADRIIVLEDGRIAASGTHEELIERCKTYQDIYSSQMGEECEKYG